MSKYTVDIKQNTDQLLEVLIKLSAKPYDDDELYRFLKKYPQKDGSMYSKSKLIIAQKKLNEANLLHLTKEQEKQLKKNIKMKSVRTISGVTPVTVLTKPFPCPGQCIFCPSDVRMPKSYLSDEPGAQRALQNKFDPYLQTFNRLVAFKNTGHPTDKVELLVLGGTWSSYPEHYQIWFIKRCFDAMNDFGEGYDTHMITPDIELPFAEESLKDIEGEKVGTKDQKNYNRTISEALVPKLQHSRTEEASTWEELENVHKINETSKTRCIGLVIETRPDEINLEEIYRIRRLGATRVQIGLQSMDDNVLSLNKRGHDVAKSKQALEQLRLAGFKILAHWMPNLYGSTPQNDIKDFDKLFSDDSIKPDELKVYPCSLIESAELMKYYKDGLWKPYSEEELLSVVSHTLTATPRYCRLNRVIRDIPSTDIVVGNKKTNFRQIAQESVKNKTAQVDIRSREIRDGKYDDYSLSLKVTQYDTTISNEYFLEFVTEEDKIAGFLRLSLPTKHKHEITQVFPELKDCAMIREIHVYGSSTEIGKSTKSGAQHKGLGSKLIQKAEELSRDSGYPKLAVISSIGTREYYKKKGFEQDGLYQIKLL